MTDRTDLTGKTLGSARPLQPGLQRRPQWRRIVLLTVYCPMGSLRIDTSRRDNCACSRPLRRITLIEMDFRQADLWDVCFLLHSTDHRASQFLSLGGIRREISSRLANLRHLVWVARRSGRSASEHATAILKNDRPVGAMGSLRKTVCRSTADLLPRPRTISQQFQFSLY